MFLAVVSLPPFLVFLCSREILWYGLLTIFSDRRYCSRNENACLVFAGGLFGVVQLFIKEPSTILRVSLHQTGAMVRTTGRSRGSSLPLSFLSLAPHSLPAVRFIPLLTVSWVSP